MTDETVTVQVVEGTVTANNEAAVPEESSSAAEVSETEESISESAKTTNVTTSKRYTVRKGDTLANISLSLYDSRDYVDTICEINDIEDPDVIYEGMVLELP